MRRVPFRCRAPAPQAHRLFELPQPATHVGVGFDALPADVRNSRVLTGNNLGQLANCPLLPDETSVNEYKLTELSDTFIALQGKTTELEAELHLRAQQLLQQGKAEEAWLTLLTFNNR